MLLKKSDIAYLGLLLAVNQIFIVLAGIIETNTIILLSGAALIVGITMAKYGTRSGIAFYVASCILGFILISNKIKFISYPIFFGSYGVIKFVIEKYILKNNKLILLEYLLKLIFFNIIFICSIFLFKQFINIDIKWWMYLAVQIMFLIYDYIYGYFIGYYMNKIDPKISNRRY